MYAFSNAVPVRSFLASRAGSSISSRPIISVPCANQSSSRATIRAAMSADELVTLGAKWDSHASSNPLEVMTHALTEFGGDVAIAFSGAEDVVLIEYASRTKLPFRVFALDTGRLHAETYRFYAEVEKHYGIKIEYTFPDTQECVDLVNEKGMFSFYEDGHQECCRVRKVRPLRKKLGTLKAWITGQRKDQSPGTRTQIPLLQLDPAFKGIGEGDLFKYNPLANTSSAEVWATIRSTEVPFNSLHNAGYISIGCEPCTRPVLPNQHEREGRWWWEEATQKECGLHKGNISKDAVSADLADDFVGDSVKKSPVVVFTKSGCEYCAALKELFGSMEVDYDEFVITEMPNYGDVAAALERKTAQNTVPNLFIGQQHIGGNEQAQNLMKDGKLVGILQTAGANVKMPAQ